MTFAMAALVLASIADVVTTRAGLRTGRLYERNPLMRWFTATMARAMSVKIAGLVLSMFWLSRTSPTWALWVAWIAALLTFRLAWQNYRLLRAIQRDSAA